MLPPAVFGVDREEVRDGARSSRGPARRRSRTPAPGGASAPRSRSHAARPRNTSLIRRPRCRPRASMVTDRSGLPQDRRWIARPRNRSRSSHLSPPGGIIGPAGSTTRHERDDARIHDRRGAIRRPCDAWRGTCGRTSAAPSGRSSSSKRRSRRAVVLLGAVGTGWIVGAADREHRPCRGDQHRDRAVPALAGRDRLPGPDRAVGDARDPDRARRRDRDRRGAACGAGGRPCGTPSPTLAAVFVRLFSFGIQSLVTLAFLCAPFAVLGGLAYLALLSRHDINYYLVEPAAELLRRGGDRRRAAGGARGPAGRAVCRPGPGDADPAASRTAAAGPRCARAARGCRGPGCGSGRSCWAGSSSARCWASPLVWGFNRSCGLLARSRPRSGGSSWSRWWPTLLAGQALLVSALSFLLVAVHCLLILRLYLRAGRLAATVAGRRGRRRGSSGSVGGSIRPRWRFVRLRTLAVLALLGFVGYLGWSVSGRLAARVPIVVVAHRGYSRRAPENTLSAFKAAIDVGADFAELDVQETSDGVDRRAPRPRPDADGGRPAADLGHHARRGAEARPGPQGPARSSPASGSPRWPR